MNRAIMAHGAVHNPDQATVDQFMHEYAGRGSYIAVHAIGQQAKLGNLESALADMRGKLHGNCLAVGLTDMAKRDSLPAQYKGLPVVYFRHESDHNTDYL